MTIAQNRLAEIFDAMNRTRIAVLGDLMLDIYISGPANRLSQEAPVPVLLVRNQEARLGGAANVMHNLMSLAPQCKVGAYGVVGDDAYGQQLKQFLCKDNIAIDGVLVDAAEQFAAEFLQLDLSITGGRRGHIRRILLAKGTLGIDQRVEQRLVISRQTHHRVVNGGVAVGIELHRLTHNVGTLGAVARQKPHLIHRIEQLSVRWLEAVDLRDGTGDDDAHRVGHIVFLYRFGDRLWAGGRVHDFLLFVSLAFLGSCHRFDRFPFCQRLLSGDVSDGMSGGAYHSVIQRQPQPLFGWEMGVDHVGLCAVSLA